MALNKKQQEAVDARNKDILVSAPAGSGKTQILVTRIMNLITKDNYNVDELLVLTFTNAAALEMKQRLTSKIDEYLSKDGIDKEHLLKQKELLNDAYITSFDTFCSDLISQYGSSINIGSFKIEEKTLSIINEVLDNCIERWLLDERFVSFLEANETNYSFSNLKGIINELHSLSCSLKDFEEYKEYLKINIYDPIIADNDIKGSLIFKLFEDTIKENLDKAIDARKQAESYIQDHYGEDEGFKSKLDSLFNYQEEIKKGLKEHSLNYQTIELETSKRIGWKKLGIDDSTKNMLNNYFDSAGKDFKKTVVDLTERLNNDNFKDILKNTYNQLEYYYKLLADFQNSYQEYKDKYNIMDFNDLERNAIKLLEPSLGVSQKLNHKLKEIMVDEYQDTNDVQETIVNLISNYDNHHVYKFMVGDMKQSIYAFRKADLNIFKDKFISYASDDDSNIKIDLEYNYRSSKCVLDSINFIFNQLMTKETGGLEYYNDEYAKLHFDLSNKSNEYEEKDISEFLLILDDKEGIMTPKMELEAILCAKRISDLVNKDNYNYEDIAILTSTAIPFITFKKVFDKYNIPNSIILSKGFLQEPEIITCLNILKAFNNPYDDIAFSSLVFNNFIFSKFDTNLIKEIKQDNTSMYLSFKDYLNNEEVTNFNEIFEEYYNRFENEPIYKVLDDFLNKADYYSFVSSLYNGEQRYNNLLLMIEMLKDDASLTLSSICNNFDKAIKYDIDYSPASIQSASSNKVKFMTVHKSKGLEFKVVFVADLDHKYNTQDSKNKIINDKEYGLALDYYHLDNIDEFKNIIVKDSNLFKNLLSNKIKKESRDEQLRVLYVALTRAKNKLILVGYDKELETIVKWQNSYLSKKNEQGPILPLNIRNSNNYLGLIGPSLISHPEINDYLKNQLKYLSINDENLDDINTTIKANAANIKIYNKDYIKEDTVKDSHFRMEISTPDQIINYTIVTNEKKKEVSNYQSYSDYKYIPLSVNTSIAVTKKINDNDEHSFEHYQEDEDSSISGSHRGSVIHSVLEQLPVSSTIDLQKELDHLFTLDLYTPEEIESINGYKDKLNNFISSDIYKLMVDSKVYKEKVFSFKDDDNQIIHGIFDVLCFKEDSIHIIDYKTDRFNNDVSDDELINAHKSQMNYYIKVLSKIFPSKSIDATLYYLNINRYVKIS